MSQDAPPKQIVTGLEPGSLTLRQAADALGSSTTTLRKMIRQGRLPEAEKVKTIEGRVWSIPADSIPGIAERSGFAISLVDTIDLREPEQPDSRELVDVADVTVTPLLTTPDAGTAPAAGPENGQEPALETEVVEPEVIPGSSIESIGSTVSVESVSEPPSLAEVIDAAFLEKLLGAKDAETQALVQVERHRTEYESLAARQLEVEQRFADADAERVQLSSQLHDEALARAIADARVIELRDQLQREITYAEAERYERRQALARETKIAAEAAETRAALGWWARRRLSRPLP